MAEGIQHPLRADLGGQVVLLGYAVSAEKVAPGETLLLTLYWQALRPMTERYTVFTHLLDAGEQIQAQMDSEPQGGGLPTDRWQVGQIVQDNYALVVRARRNARAPRPRGGHVPSGDAGSPAGPRSGERRRCWETGWCWARSRWGTREHGGNVREKAMSQKRHPLIRELWAPLLLLLAALGFFWRILFTPDAWKPAGGGDLVSFLFPMYRFAAASLRAGELPLWNPHLYGGAPFLADMQSGLFYPPNLLLFLLAPEFSYRAMEWMVVFHVFLAGLFMYLCLRYMEPGRPVRVPAALAGAIAYMFSDLFIVHFGNLNLVAVAAWLPLIFLLFWRALRTRSLWLAVGAGVAFGVSTLAGHLQITLFIGLALVVAAAVEGLTKSDTGHQDGRGGRDWGWSLLVLAITVAVAIGLAAVVLLPAFEYTRLSPRATLSYREAARYSLVPALLGEMLVPALFSSREPSLYWGVWDRVAVGYLGIFPLILAFLAILLVRGRRVRIFVVLAVVAFLLALGGESIIHGWAYWLLPGFGQLRAPARFVLLVGFALAALAAIGLDRLLSPLDRPRRRLLDSAWRGLLWFAGAVAVAGGLWAYLVIFQSQDRDPVLFWRVSMAGSGVVFALLLLGAALAWLSARRSGRVQAQDPGLVGGGLDFLGPGIDWRLHRSGRRAPDLRL